MFLLFELQLSSIYLFFQVGGPPLRLFSAELLDDRLQRRFPVSPRPFLAQR
jgi:hypothetical protein